MRICLIGEYDPVLDEGMRKVAFHLAQGLSRSHEVLPLNIKGVFTSSFWRKIKEFRPQIVHYIHGPTVKSLILMKILLLYCKQPKTVISAMRPRFSYISARFIPWLKPDLVLTQSYETEAKLSSLGCRTAFLPCGVDTDRFVPVSPEAKAALRRKHGIDDNKFVLLHVGSIKPGRGVHWLARLRGKDTQVIIVGPTSVGIRGKTVRKLSETGCLVWTDYFENVEEVYALADCYIYPTMPLTDALGRAVADSIEMPLSILEAMSCNLPVISTKFGALPRIFETGDGFYFAEKEEDLIERLHEVKSHSSKVRTREKVLAYSWKIVVRQLEQIYANLICGLKRS